MPATWHSWAGKYLGNANAAPTNANQDAVAKAHIRELMNRGYDERQIAMIWNGGQPYRKVGTTTTTNGRTIRYDTGHYADSVLALLPRAPGSVQLASAPAPEQPTTDVPSVATAGMFDGLAERIRKQQASSGPKFQAPDPTLLTDAFKVRTMPQAPATAPSMDFPVGAPETPKPTLPGPRIANLPTQTPRVPLPAAPAPSMTFSVGEGMNNTTDVLPGPRRSTLEAIQRGENVNVTPAPVQTSQVTPAYRAVGVEPSATRRPIKYDKIEQTGAKATDVLNTALDPNKNLGVKILQKPVGKAVEIAGTGIGGLIGGLGNLLTSVAEGHPAADTPEHAAKFWKDVTDTARSTGEFGRQTGEQGAAMATLGFPSEVGGVIGSAAEAFNTLAVLPQVASVYSDIKQGNITPETGINAAASLLFGAGAVKSMPEFVRSLRSKSSINDIAGAAADMLGVERQVDALGRMKRVPRAEIERAYQAKLAGGVKDPFSLETAKSVLLDHASLPTKQFTARYQTPLLKLADVLEKTTEAPAVKPIQEPQAAPGEAIPAPTVREAVPALAEAIKAPSRKSVSTDVAEKSVMLPIKERTTDLAEKAKIYKTPEEFVKAQGRTLFRGGIGEGSSFSTWKSIAEDFAKNRGGSVKEYVLKPDAKIANYSDVPGVEYKNITEEYLDQRKDKLNFMEGELEQEFKKAEKWAKDNGYDAISLPVEGEIRVMNKDVIVEKKRLTDIWEASNGNKANAAAPVVNGKASKVGKSIEAKSIEQGLAATFPDTAQYDPITIKEQAQKAADLINTDFERAERIVLGQERLPDGLLGGTIIKAMEDYAMKNNDVELALAIAKSPLTAETSIHAQEMRMLAERNPDSAVANIQKLERIKREARAKKGGSVEKVVQDIRKEINRTKPERIRKETWGDFITSITC